LHLLTLTGPPPEAARTPPSWDPAERAKALRVLRIKRQELEAEIGQLESQLQRYMESAGIPEIAAGDGALRLVQEEGAPAALVWGSRPSAETARPPGADETG
jgi:hypothetical protein